MNTIHSAAPCSRCWAARLASPRWLLLAAPALGGCAPTRPSVEIAGSLFPAWMICLLGGLAVAALGRAAFSVFGLNRELRPAGLVHACLALASTLALWLAFFRPAP